MKSEIKENVQGTNSEGKKTGTQINGVQQRRKTWKEKSSDPFHRERAFFQGAAVVWMRVDFLHGDKFFQHFYLHVPSQ